MKISVLKISNFNCVDIDKLMKYISEEKSKKVRRFYKKEDKVRGILSDLVIRKMLIDELEISNYDINFRKNEYGKPYLLDKSDIHFNISHSGEYIACALDYKPIGIDIEKIKNNDFLGITKGFFSTREQEYILERNEEDVLEKNRDRFFQIWALKESFVKCVGKGLSMPFDEFTVYFDNENKILVDTNLTNNTYIFKEFEIDGYKLSVCSQGNEIIDNINFIAMEDIEREWG